MNPKRIGKKIKIARIERGWTQSYLGKVTHLLQKTISNYETGKVLPQLMNLEKLALSLRKKISYFLR